jgi:hypothetical protein
MPKVRCMRATRGARRATRGAVGATHGAIVATRGYAFGFSASEALFTQ